MGFHQEDLLTERRVAIIFRRVRGVPGVPVSSSLALKGADVQPRRRTLSTLSVH